MQSPGFPVNRPVTSAANPAEPSCAVRIKSMPPRRIASINGSTLPLGMPKPVAMPAARNVATIKSALFMKRPWPGLAHESVGEEVVDRRHVARFQKGVLDHEIDDVLDRLPLQLAVEAEIEDAVDL